MRLWVKTYQNWKAGFILLSIFVSIKSAEAQKLKAVGTILATSSSYDVPEGEYWKVSRGLTRPTMQPPSGLTPEELHAYYEKLYNPRLEDIRPLDLTGGMLLDEQLPMWINQSSSFQFSPGSMMEIFIQKFRIEDHEQADQK